MDGHGCGLIKERMCTFFWDYYITLSMTIVEGLLAVWTYDTLSTLCRFTKKECNFLSSWVGMNLKMAMASIHRILFGGRNLIPW